MSERLMKEMMVRLSLDMDDFRKEMTNVQEQVRRSMEKVEREFGETSDELDKLSGDFKKFKKTTDDSFDKMADSAKANSKEMVNAINKGFGKITSGAKSIARTLATAFSVRAVVGFGKALVDSSADLYALEAQFTQVFKGMEEEANKSIERMSKEFGMLPNRLKGDLSAFTSQFKGLGLDDTKALEEAENALTLSADAAAFFDMTIEDATEHVRSFIKGNYVGGESVQLFGSETMIATWASKNMGSELKALGGKWKNLDEASKQYFRMRYAEQMYKEAGVTGQANREMDMYANVMGNATQAWKDFKAELGTKLLDKTTDAFKRLSDLLNEITESDAISKLAETFGNIGALVFDKAVAGLEKFVGWVNSVDWWLVGQQLGTIWGHLKEFASGAWDAISEAIEPVAEFVKDLFEAFGGGDDEDAPNTENMDNVNASLTKAKPIFEWLANNGEAVGEGISAIAYALAGWKAVKITADVAGWFTEVANAGGIVAWLGSKLKLGGVLPSVAGSAGLAVGEATGGLTLGTIVIPVALGVVIDWIWNLGGDPREELEDKGVDSSRQNWLEGNKTRRQKINAEGSTKSAVTKRENGRDVFDWESTGFTRGLVDFKDGVIQFFEDLDWKAELKGIGEAIANSWMGSLWDGIVKWCDDFDLGSKLIKLIIPTNITEDLEGGMKFSDVIEELITIDDTWNNIVTWFEEHDLWEEVKKWLAPGEDDQNISFSTVIDRIFTLDDKFQSIKSFWDEHISPMIDGWKTSLSTLKTDVGNNISAIQKEWHDFWDDLTNSKFVVGLKSFLNKMIEKLNSGVRKFLSGINYIIKGINWVYKKVTGNKEGKFGEIQLDKWKIGTLAKGTNNWRGGTALVGEAGRELVSDPKLGTFMADRPMILPLSKGASVLRNSKTEKLLRKTGITAFAGGTNESIWDSLLDGFGTLWEYMTNPSKLWDKILEKIDLDFGDNPIISGLADGVKNIFKGDFITNWIKKLFDDSMPTTANVSSVNSWRPYIIKAASFFGETLTENEILRVLQQIKNESGGNQTIRQSSAVQDINAKTGNWARGLLQYVPSTFNAYKVSGFGNINNGFHQLLAFFNNSTWRKALPQLGVKRGWSPRGSRRKAKNGILVNGATPLTVGEAGQEAVVPLSNARALKPFGQSVMNALEEEVASGGEGAVYEFNIPVIVDGREIARATATFTKEELDKMEKRNNRLNGRK